MYLLQRSNGLRDIRSGILRRKRMTSVCLSLINDHLLDKIISLLIRSGHELRTTNLPRTNRLVRDKDTRNREVVVGKETCLVKEVESSGHFLEARDDFVSRVVVNNIV